MFYSFTNPNPSTTNNQQKIIIYEKKLTKFDFFLLDGPLGGEGVKCLLAATISGDFLLELLAS